MTEITHKGRSVDLPGSQPDIEWETVTGFASDCAVSGRAPAPVGNGKAASMNRAQGLLSVSCVLAFLALPGASALFAQGAPSPSGGALATYRNQDYSFTLQYPADLSPAEGGETWSAAASANGGSEAGTAIVTIPVVNIDHDSTKPYPYPLFFTAWVSVGVSPDTADCYEDIQAEPNNYTPRDVTIGGLPFKVGTTSDAGMMKYTVVTSYRIIHNGACYAVEQAEYGSSYRDENTLPGLSHDQLQAYYDQAGTIARSIRFTDAPPEAAVSQAVVPFDAVTLKFARGATRILVKGSLAAGASGSYVLGAEAGQLVVLTALGQAGNDPSLVITSLPDGTVLQPGSLERSVWTTVLSKSQELLVQEKNRGMAASYELSVMVPALVRPRPGGGTVTRSGSTPAGLPVDYIVRALAGWKVKVSLESTGNGASLKTIGLISGSDVVAVNDLSGEAASDRLELAPSSNRDYLVSVLPKDGTDVSYQLTLTVSAAP